MILLSRYLDLGNKLEELGVLDQVLDFDVNYFININRIKETKVKEFSNSYENINKFFEKIIILLRNANSTNSRCYKEAFKRFNFPEVNGIGLGYSKSEKGSGFGIELRKKVVRDAKEIIDAGIKDPEIFHLIGLFEDKIGPDRLSDMFAKLIENDIENYTKGIYENLNINKNKYPNCKFDEDGFLLNPFKKDIKVLLLPKDILHELPIAKDWDDIDRVCREIEKIKNEVNSLFKINLSKMSQSSKKLFIKDSIIKDNTIFNKLIEEYKKSNVEVYDFDKDPVGIIKLVTYMSNIDSNDFKEKIDINNDTFEITKCICNRFKYLIENKKGYQMLYDSDGKFRNEKIVQQLFILMADSYCKANNIDLSPECNSGRGPVDFKLSNGDNNKTLVEIKLTTNNQLVHGLEKQIFEYSKAEETQNLIYLVVHNGGPDSRIKSMNEVYKKISTNRIKLIFINALKKESASKY